MDSSKSKEDACIGFIRDLWLSHQEAAIDAPVPLFVGFNGVQGAGKTMLVGYLFLEQGPYC